MRWASGVIAMVIAVLVVLPGIGGAAVAGIAPEGFITVNSTADVVADDGACTLREAITAADLDAASGGMGGECAAGDGADTIEVPAGVYVLALAGSGEEGNLSGDLDVDSDIMVRGAGAHLTVIDGGGIDRVFDQHSGVVQLTGVTVRNGHAPDGAALRDPGAHGGGMYIRGGGLTLEDVIVHSNQAGRGHDGGSGATNGHGADGGNGGGIAVDSEGAVSLTLVNSAVRQNKAGAGGDGGAGGGKLPGGRGGDGGHGGGIYAGEGSLVTMVWTTVDGNASGKGGEGSGSVTNRGMKTALAGTGGASRLWER